MSTKISTRLLDPDYSEDFDMSVLPGSDHKLIADQKVAPVKLGASKSNQLKRNLRNAKSFPVNMTKDVDMLRDFQAVTRLANESKAEEVLPPPQKLKTFEEQLNGRSPGQKMILQQMSELEISEMSIDEEDVRKI